MTRLMSPQKTQPTLVKEPHTVPTLDNILGSLVSQIPEQKLPDKETCGLISTIFADLAEAHKQYGNAARGLADIAGLISLEQLTLVLAAAVLPTLQLVLPPGQISPLTTPPPPQTTAMMVAGRQDMIKYCKNMILQTLQQMPLKNVMNIHQHGYLQLLSSAHWRNTFLMKQRQEQRLLAFFILWLLSFTKL